MKETDKIQILKDILFEDDTVYLERMSRRLEQLENTLNERQKLSSKVDPLIIHQINEFKESIPTTLGPTITATLKSEIEHHKDDVIDALFPIIGKMIKKYVEQEIKQLSEKINSQLGFSGRIKSIFGSSKEKKELIDDLIAPTHKQ